MIATTIMAVVMIGWCIITLIYRGGPVNPVTWKPDLEPKYDLNKKVEYEEVEVNIAKPTTSSSAGAVDRARTGNGRVTRKPAH